VVDAPRRVPRGEWSVTTVDVREVILMGRLVAVVAVAAIDVIRVDEPGAVIEVHAFRVVIHWCPITRETVLGLGELDGGAIGNLL
jgi:kynurenine formamidase